MMSPDATFMFKVTDTWLAEMDTIAENSHALSIRWTRWCPGIGELDDGAPKDAVLETETRKETNAVCV